MAEAEFRAEPEAMRVHAGNVGGIIMQGLSALGELEGAALAPAAFASFGAAVGSTGSILHGEQVSALRSLLGLLEHVGDMVRRSADEYDAADRAVADGYGDGRAPGRGLMSTIWNGNGSSELARQAMSDGTGAGRPHSVAGVLRYLDQARLGVLDDHPLSASRFPGVAEFNDWLAGNADNQARLGVIEVYAGTARGLGDVPGGVHSGDMVVVEPLAGRHPHPVIGVAGHGGQLYNQGLVHPDIRGLARLSVYRPASA